MTDYIIIGAGSAGCVLANRLSESATVTLLEAGPVDRSWDFRLHMPAALSELLKTKWYNWNYESEPEPHLNNRRLFCPRGKVLGGSSSINGMIFVRGNPEDFNRWASVYGLSDWDYTSCLPYFQKSETALFGDQSLRGSTGPLQISRGALDNPLSKAWIDAVQQAGFPVTTDFNGTHQEGAGPFDQTIHKGKRQSIARAYLHPVKSRKNLTIVPNAQVKKIRMRNGRAVGVEYQLGSTTHILEADQEVILCGGAINSPHLLMLSGIGCADELKAQDIKPEVDLPGVGKNLQDHLEIYIQYACKEPVSIYPSTLPLRKPLVGLKWLLNQTGDGATNHFESGAFLKSQDAMTFPDLQFHFLPIAMDYDGKDQYMGHGFQAHVGPMKPISRGTVGLRSSNPFNAPRIQFNYHEAAEDRKAMFDGIQLARKIISQKAFDRYRGEELRPGTKGSSIDDLDVFVRRHAESAYHPSGTCRMGSSEQSVVDSEGRVHNMKGLRVVDASIMPEITNGNLNAPVVMIAEKIADSILSA